MSEDGDPDGGDEQKTLTVRIDKSEKERWRKEVDKSPRWRDLTHLVFDGVQTVIQQEKQDEPLATMDTVTDVELGPVEDKLAAMEGRLESMDDHLEIVRMNTSYLLDLQGEQTDLTTDIYELLPAYESDIEAKQVLKSADLDQFDEPDMKRAEQYGCVDDIVANFSAYGETFVRDEVNRLINEFTGDLHQLSRGSHRFVYEVV